MLHHKFILYFNLLVQSIPEDAPPQVHEFVAYMADIYIGIEVYETIQDADYNNGLVIRFRRTARWKSPKLAPKTLFCV